MLHRVAVVSLGLLLVSCASAPRAPSAGPTSATATIRDAAGTEVGTASLSQTQSGVLVSASLSGIGSGTHGMHVHEVGRCDAPAFATAGSHFNPEKKQHGYRNPTGAHAGDLPNVSPPPGGSLTFDVLLPNASLSGRNALLDGDGASIVIHASADDYQTAPSGNSGARIACGVIVGR